jgi:type IV secretion system protein VirB10
MSDRHDDPLRGEEFPDDENDYPDYETPAFPDPGAWEAGGNPDEPEGFGEGETGQALPLDEGVPALTPQGESIPKHPEGPDRYRSEPLPEESDAFGDPETEQGNPDGSEGEDPSGEQESPEADTSIIEDPYGDEPDDAGQAEGPGEFEQQETEQGNPDDREGEDGASGQAGSLSTGDASADLDTQPYSEEKKPPDNFIKSKPAMLNRQFILYCIGGAAILLFVFSLFILPELKKKRAANEQRNKQTPVPVSANDYSSLVPRSEDGTPAAPHSSAGFFYEPDDDVVLDSLPPIDYRFQNENHGLPAAAPVTTTSTGSGAGYIRPDTRTDRLQSKTISGIRGLTPTQQQYLSDSFTPARQDSQAPISPDNPYAQFGLPPKEDYINQMLGQQQYTEEEPYYSSQNNTYVSQNDQSSKLNFFNQGMENAGNGYWLSPYSLWPGTIFEAILTSAVNTDLPGECTAVISKNVYSSQDGNYLLIPQNSRLLGTYNSSVSYSQRRVQVGWHTLIRPDGYFVNLGNMPAADSRGASGLPGIINEHPFQYLKALALLSAMNVINSELGYSMAGTTNQFVQDVMANTQNIANTLGGKMIDRALDIQPTIVIREGTKINIVVSTTVVLPVINPYPVTYPYQRTR